ncbi:MAG: hypothetical protein WA459_20790 [Stellaceae bacterium]
MATSTTIDSGATYDISAGQTDTGDSVLNGGTLNVDAGGAASGTLVQGSETVSAGGADSTATVVSGGVQQVYGSASGATVSSGGTQIVASGGTASDTVIQGGTLDLQAGGVLGGVGRSALPAAARWRWTVRRCRPRRSPASGQAKRST